MLYQATQQPFFRKTWQKQTSAEGLRFWLQEPRPAPACRQFNTQVSRESFMSTQPHKQKSNKIANVYLVPGTFWKATATCKQNSTESPRDITCTAQQELSKRSEVIVKDPMEEWHSQRHRHRCLSLSTPSCGRRDRCATNTKLPNDMRRQDGKTARRSPLMLKENKRLKRRDGRREDKAPGTQKSNLSSQGA